MHQIFDVPATRHHQIVMPVHPHKLNQLLTMHWSARAAAKERDAMAIWACSRDVPPAGGKRRVSLRLEGWKRGRLPDPDAYWKTVLDGLVRAGCLLDDSSRWCELGSVEIVRAQENRTVITLEDVV